MSPKPLMLLFATLFMAAPPATAAPAATTAEGDTTRSTAVTFQITAETALGSGPHTAFLLTANRHHTLATRSNTASLRAALHASHRLARDLTLSGCVDAITAVHADHKAYLQQCYARLAYKSFYIEAGSREDSLVVRHRRLASGSFIKGTNAKPVPQIRLGTLGFWDLPLTRHWVQVNFDAGYGRFLDSRYRKEMFFRPENTTTKYASNALYHQKHLYIRSNPQKPVFVMVGIEHAVQFGGTYHYMDNGMLKVKEEAARLKTCWDVILPLGDSRYFENDVWENWVYGNHLGVMTYQLGLNIDSRHRLQAYCDNPFEDGSGVRKGNGYDGIWGIEYTSSAPGRQIVRGALFEYVQTTNQCGPLHWDSGDYPEPIRSQITDFVTGNDNYYNHGIYGSYAHYGMTPGNPLITSPIYNDDGDTNFSDNRIRAWYAGVEGELTARLSYLAKACYREGLGTYVRPLPERHHAFSALLEGCYRAGPWQIGAAWAIDRGNMTGNCSTFNFKISYHGKIL